MTPEEHIQTMDEFVRDSQNIFTDGGMAVRQAARKMR